MRGQWISYTQPQLDFIKANCVLDRATLTLRVNNEFGTGYSVDNIKSLCTRKGWKTGRNGQFKKGNIPHPNARPRGPNKTSFKPGHKPKNYRKVGSERISKDGYREIKVAEGMFQWRLKHRIVWEQHHQVQLADEDIIRFKDGDPLNCSIDNLEKFNRAEHAMLNKLKVNEIPEEIRPTVKNSVRLQAKIHQLEVATP